MTINLSMPVTHELRPRITVVGVGGAGTNAVNNMITAHLEGVEFVSCNTDAQSLTQCLSERRVQLGTSITQGLGAGARPEIGRAAAEEVIDEILDQLQGSHMVFITAGMGGGTGTGAAPVIARAVREQGILTVGVVTRPFHFEGAHRMRVAEGGLKELQEYVDTLIVIPNQNLFRIANERTTFADAFKLADNVLHMGVRGVTDLMVMPGLINLDFADIRTVMSEMGKAMMGTGEASGDRRSVEAAEAAISNPLLDDVSMHGARGVLINITGGPDMTLFEVDEAANRIKEEVDPDANIIVGSTLDESMEGHVRVSVVATGIEQPTQLAGKLEASASADLSSELKAGTKPGGTGSGSPPSFRLRPQTPPANLPPKVAAALGKEPRSEPVGAVMPRFGAIPAAPTREWPKPAAEVEKPMEAPALAEGSGADVAEGGAAIKSPTDETSRTHPALRPQDRFAEWGQVRAPARELARGPSLIERVTQSIVKAMPERTERQPAAVHANAGAISVGTRPHDDEYEIPAFLRR